jgi:hypothetical protein
LSAAPCDRRSASGGRASRCNRCRGRSGRDGLVALDEAVAVGLPEPAKVTAMATITAPLSSRAAAAARSLEAPAPGHRDGTIRSPASYPTRAMERQSSEVWCQPAGARKSRGRMLLSGPEKLSGTENGFLPPIWPKSVPSMSSPKSSPRGNFFSFLRDSWFQDKPSTPRVPRWCSRLAGHGEAGTPAVLACRWPGHCRVLAWSLPCSHSPSRSFQFLSSSGWWLRRSCGPFGSPLPSIRFDHIT